MNNLSKTDDFYCEFVFSGKVKVKKVKENNTLLAFHHTQPSYQTHIIIVPKKHILSLLKVDDLDLIKEIFKMTKEIIKDKKLNKTNYKIIVNGGSFQDSKHLHFHLVSGEKIKNV